MKRILLGCLTALSLHITAQITDTNHPSAIFNKDTIDFGTIFKFDNKSLYLTCTNKSKLPLVVSDNICFSPFNLWVMHKRVDPGLIDTIKVTMLGYDTGTFFRAILIITNARPSANVIYVKGKVILSPYDPKAPEITFERDTTDFGNISLHSSIRHSLKFTNTGKSPLLIREVRGSDPCFFSWPHELIQPGQSGELTVYMPTDYIRTYMKSATIEINASPGIKVIYVKGRIVDTNAPILTLESDIIDYGIVAQGSDGYRYFKFTNTGKKPLKINYLFSNNDTKVTYTTTNDSIKPGQNGIIKVHYDTWQTGKFYKSCNVSYNYYDHKIIYLKGEVLPDTTQLSSH
jgi:hypothetical protein